MESIIATEDEIRRFLACSGYGYGSGSGDGDGIKQYDGFPVHYIDTIACIITSIHNGIASVLVIGGDLALNNAYVAKVGHSFAHGLTPREAAEAATRKELEDSPIEDRVDSFVDAHPELDTPYGDLFEWHHILTGSCEFGRREWCKSHGYEPTDRITVRTFIEQTRNDYGGDVIRQLADEYGIEL